MDTVSFNEVIISYLFTTIDVDESNAIEMFRQGQANVEAYLSVVNIKVNNRPVTMDQQLPIPMIDDVMVMVTENGNKSLFATE